MVAEVLTRTAETQEQVVAASLGRPVLRRGAWLDRWPGATGVYPTPSNNLSEATSLTDSSGRKWPYRSIVVRISR